MEIIKKVLMFGHYIEPPWCDGIVNTVKGWSEGLTKLGLRVSVLSTSSDHKKELMFNHVKYNYFFGTHERFGVDSTYTIRFQFNLFNFLLRKHSYEIYHFNLLDALTYIPLFSMLRSLGGKLFLSFHNKDNVNKYTKKLIHRIFNILIVPNKDVKDFLIRLGVPDNKISIIPPCVNTKLFCPKDTEVCKYTIGLPQDAFIMLYAGHFKRGRGLEQLISIFEKLRRLPSKRILLVLAWTGFAEKGYFPRIWERVRHNPDIVILGPQNDMSLVYNCANVVVSPILRSEYVTAVPLNVIEAMACGRLVISTSIGVGDFLDDGFNGFTVEPNNLIALERKLSLILNQKVDSKEIGSRARDTICRRFSELNVARRLKELYES